MKLEIGGAQDDGAKYMEDLFVRADSPLIQFSGRSIIDASGARSFDFPGALISARIVGYGSITAILNESGTNRYAASLDGGKSWLPDTINTISGRHEYTIPLEPTRLRGDFQLLKLTESLSDKTNIYQEIANNFLQLNQHESALENQRMVCKLVRLAASGETYDTIEEEDLSESQFEDIEENELTVKALFNLIQIQFLII